MQRLFDYCHSEVFIKETLSLFRNTQSFMKMKNHQRQRISLRISETFIQKKKTYLQRLLKFNLKNTLYLEDLYFQQLLIYL